MTAAEAEGTTVMRISVDPERCQGHTLCSMTAPELFTISDIDGHSSVTMTDVPAELRDKARRAALGCPEEAIVITEEAS